jgi:hypothetical protein
MVLRRSAGATEMNIGCMDARESNHQRQGESNDQQEYRPVREDISDQAHQPGCRKTSRRGKALVAAKPFGQSRMTDQPKTDRDDRRPQDSTGHSLQRQSDQNQQKVRPKLNDYRAESQHQDTERYHRPLGAGTIQQLAPRHLTEQTGEGTGA